MSSLQSGSLTSSPSYRSLRAHLGEADPVHLLRCRPSTPSHASSKPPPVPRPAISSPLCSTPSGFSFLSAPFISCSLLLMCAALSVTLPLSSSHSLKLVMHTYHTFSFFFHPTFSRFSRCSPRYLPLLQNACASRCRLLAVFKCLLGSN